MTNQKNLIDDSIIVLRLDIKNLTGMIVEQYKKVISSIKTRDIDTALEVIKNDGEINQLCEDIDLETIIVIARYQPVASDLRRVMTINKLAYEFERVADYAKNIAEYVITGKKLNVLKTAEIIASFEKMFEIIFRMLKTNLQAFLDEDKLMAREALLMDNEIDELYKSNFDELLQKFKQTNDESEQHMISRALVLNKQIERAGDHLTNVSEQILYLIKGKRFNAE
ncbi:MAG: PhoU family transcriptional regulator [Haloplasmataceae bacterium]|jgi:phosphate transport system protein|nr:PhoU family transcriptional regulator [Haloplasmataceae bacterium]